MPRLRLQLRPGDRERIARCLRLSLHALHRAAERGVSLTDIQLVLRHGAVRPTWRGLRFKLHPAQRSARPAVARLVVIVDLEFRIPTIYWED